MLAACGGEAAGGVEIVGCGIEKLCGGKIGCAIAAADDDYTAIEQSCGCSFGARCGHRWARRNASRLRIVNIGRVERVRAVARTAQDEHAAIAQNCRSVILAR